MQESEACVQDGHMLIYIVERALVIRHISLRTYCRCEAYRFKIFERCPCKVHRLKASPILESIDSEVHPCNLLV